MTSTVVHQASPRAVEAVLARFHEAGIDAVALDRPNAIALLFSFGTYRVRIAVPEGDAARARRVLEEWDRQSGPRVRDLTRGVLRQFARAAVVALVATAALLLLPAGRRAWPWLPVVALAVWFASLVAIGLLQRRRSHAEAPGER